ncbi:MAG: peptidoglycan editing factor PgeF [Cyanobacteria bacterium CRU_2_1]|nr:peptidoglycan editing factor PgeF [Cyanobacteria bacterium RU_5_0]NJR57677.1 peptidoglycan editing factor PgeF [Cyanobacteria bacterium CRU_2_1]
MYTWHWHIWQGLPYLTCSLLKDWQHGFFTQQFWSRPPETLVEVLHPTAKVYRVKQVHGNTVLNATEIGQGVASERSDLEDESELTSLPNADGLLTEQDNQAVWVCTADCTPVLIADAETGQVAAVHAGWRGTLLAIVPNAVKRMQAQGSQLENLRIAMGPAIAGEVYQVSTTVAAQVGATVLNSPIASTVNPSTNLESPDTVADPEPILDALRQLPNSPLLDDPQPGRARLDVRRVNALQLKQMGIGSEQMAIAPYCTYQNPDLFFSYRRERQKKVQWSGIVSRESS